MLSASDIDTYRTCPLKYKFARVFRIPQEPTLHQRFGIVVHQVLERFHSGEGPPAGLPQLLGLLDASWRRGGFGDSEEERQLRGKAAAALTRYHERFQTEECEPVWFERQFTFKLGPHLLRGRVDRVDLPAERRLRADRLQDRPPQDRRAARRRRPALAVRGRRARGVESRRLAPGVLLRARRREGERPARRRRPLGMDHARSRWRSPRGSSRRDSSRRRRSRRARSAITGWCVRRLSAEARFMARRDRDPGPGARRRRAGAGSAGGHGRSSRRRAAGRSRRLPPRRPLARAARRTPARPGRSARRG